MGLKPVTAGWKRDEGPSMAYELAIPDDVLTYLDGLPLSERGRAAVAAALEYVTALPEGFRSDPANRVAPGHPYLRYSLLFTDPDGDGHLHTISFLIDDRAAQYGVLRIPYAEHTVGNPMP
jgi:hypothetical protein